MLMTHTPVYMDNHATTRVDPRVVEAMQPFWCEAYGNAASISHAFGHESGCRLRQGLLKCAAGQFMRLQQITQLVPITVGQVIIGNKPVVTFCGSQVEQAIEPGLKASPVIRGDLGHGIS